MSYIGKQPRKAALTSSDIEDGIITAAKIEDGAVVAAEIASNAVTTAKINADAVTAAKIADDVINSEHIAADSIDAEHYAAGSVDTTALGADAVTGAKIADDAINSEHYTDGSIDTAHIADVNVTQGKIADQAINEAKMQISNAPQNGYMLTAQSGNTGGMTWAEAAGGAFTLLSTTTISSAVSAVDITSNIDSTFVNYMFVATDIHVSNDDRNILLRVFSADGSPDTTTNCFHYAGVGRTSGGTLLGKNSGGGNNQAEVNILEQGNAAAEKSDFIMYMYNPSGTTHHKGFYTLSNVINSAGLFVNGTMSQSYRKTIAITGVRFFPNAGTIESGQIKLYGIS